MERLGKSRRTANTLNDARWVRPHLAVPSADGVYLREYRERVRIGYELPHSRSGAMPACFAKCRRVSASWRSRPSTISRCFSVSGANGLSPAASMNLQDIGATIGEARQGGKNKKPTSA